MADSVAGNASTELKQRTYDIWMRVLAGEGSGDFGAEVKPHVKFVRMDVDSGDPQSGISLKKTTCTIVHEATVTEDFLNAASTMHGGCTAFLVDICSSIALEPFVMFAPRHVTLNLNINYHAPAVNGAPLKIISTTVAVGRRVQTIRVEIWDTSKQTLVASAHHMKMESSAPQHQKLSKL